MVRTNHSWLQPRVSDCYQQAPISQDRDTGQLEVFSYNAALRLARRAVQCDLALPDRPNCRARANALSYDVLSPAAP
jgi:hypothetical protein